MKKVKDFYKFKVVFGKGKVNKKKMEDIILPENPLYIFRTYIYKIVHQLAKYNQDHIDT